MDALVTAVVDLLRTRGGYRPLVIPLKLRDMTFQFDAALLGPQDNGDIVLVSGLADQQTPLLRRRVTAFITLLDRLHDPRSVTLVLIARGEIPNNTHELEKLCRVLLVTPATHAESVLRPLFQLTLPVHDRDIEQLDLVLDRELEELRDDPMVRELLAAAQEGADSINEVLSKYIAVAALSHRTPGAAS